MNLPHGADEILNARKRGKRPADAVLITLGQYLDESNPMVVIEDHQRIGDMDLRFLHGLEVLIVDYSKKPATFNPNRMFDLVGAILRVEPQYLGLVVDDLPRGWTIVENGQRVMPMRQWSIRDEIEWEKQNAPH